MSRRCVNKKEGIDPALRAPQGCDGGKGRHLEALGKAGFCGGQRHGQLSPSRRAGFSGEHANWCWRLCRIWTEGDSRVKCIKGWVARLGAFSAEPLGHLGCRENGVLTSDNARNHAGNRCWWSWLRCKQRGLHPGHNKTLIFQRF